MVKSELPVAHGAAPAALRASWRSLWPLALLLAIAAAAIFTNLGRDRLWADEGDTAVLGANILKYGVPRAWDGTTLIDPDGGNRMNANLVMVSHPWVQYYAAAASFALLGRTTFAARAPFALGGLVTIALLYLTVLTASGRRSAAVISGVLAISSVQFLLYARQARNYSLTMAFACALVLVFWRLTSRRAAVLFAILAIVAFHTSPTAWAPCAAFAVLTLVAPSCRIYRRWFWRAAPFIALGTVPWTWLAASGYSANTAPLASLARLWPRTAQFLIEYASATPILAVVVFWCLYWMVDRRQAARAPRPESVGRRARRSVQTPVAAGWLAGERQYFLTVATIAAAYGGMLVAAESVDNLFVAGLRYAAPLIPLTIGGAALCLARLTRGRPLFATAIVTVFIATNVGRLTPWAPLLAEAGTSGTGAPSVHVPTGWKVALVHSSLWTYARDLRRDNPGTVTAVAAFLRSHAAPTDVVITNYEWEPLYFHTGLPQGLKLAPSSPAYIPAKLHGLPDSVFSVANARWLVWRWAWNGYMGYEWTSINRRLADAGAHLVKVAEVPETVWENRESLYFHRFSTGQYLYQQSSDQARPAEIYRIEWGAAPGSGTGAP